VAESTRNAEAFARAAAFYQQAIARDPNFALAMARLVENRIGYHWFINWLNEAELGEVKKTAEHALALAPNLAEAHLALGLYYYHGERDYDRALVEIGRALELQPNNVRALELSGNVHLRQGLWELSLSEIERCELLDPRNASLPEIIGFANVCLRRWREASRAGWHSLALDPHNFEGMRDVFWSCLNGSGDIQEAALRAGEAPDRPGWGEEPPERWGILSDGVSQRPVKSEPGAYQRFYEGMVRCLRDGAPPPVDAEDAVKGLEIIEAARRSATERRVVTLA